MFKQIVVVPAYRPSDKLIDLLANISKEFSNIVIVDDGGGIEYSHVFEAIYKTCPNVKILNHAFNQGKGRAIKTAINYCISEIDDRSKYGIITVDADGQHLVKDIIKVAELMEKYPDRIVLGCRTFDGKSIPLRSKLGNTISKYVYRYLCNIDVSDTQTGLRGIPGSVLPLMANLNGERYEYETNMLIKVSELSIPYEEVPISTIYEENNASSHFHPVKDSIKIYLQIIRTEYVKILKVLIGCWMFIKMIKCLGEEKD